MGVTIESLELEISASSQSAESSLTNLIATLDKLKGATKGGCGLSGVSKQITKFADGCNSLSAENIDKFSAMINALKGLGELKGLKLSSTIGKRLGEITTSINGISLVNVGIFGEMVNSLNMLHGIQDVKISSTIAKSIREIGEASSKLDVDGIICIGFLGETLGSLRAVEDVRISSSIGTQIGEITKASAEISEDKLANIRNMAGALSSLSSVRDVKLSSTIGKNLLDIAIAAEQMQGIDFGVFNTMVAPLQQLSGIGRASNLSSIIKELAKIPELMQALNAQDVADFADKITQLANALNPLVTQLNSLNGSLRSFTPSITQAANATRQMGSASASSIGSVTDLYSAVRLASNGVRSIARKIAQWMKKSNSYVEDVNLFTASLGKYATKAEKYAEQVGELMGIDPGKWMRNQGVFMTLVSGFGVASDKAYLMSKNLTQLGYDLSSFFNIPVDEAMQKLQSGISGELEPLRRLGYDLSEARLKAEAASLGIKKAFKDMTQAEKSQLRYQAILSQVTTAQGDMARTLDTPANQLRILSSAAEQAARALGNVFIPVLNAILPIAIAVANAIRAIVSAIASLFGFAMPSIDYSGIEGATDATNALGDSLESAGGGAKKLNDLLADWDELNIIQSNSGGGGGGGSSAIDPSQWDFDLSQYDFLGNLVTSKAQEMYQKIKPIVDWMTDHIQGLLSLVQAVGFGLGAWSLARSLFPDMLKTMAGLNKIKALALDIVVISIMVKLVYDFDTKFIESDGTDWFQVIADGLTTAMGAAITGAVTKHAFGSEGAGMYAAGITLVVSAGASILASFEGVKRKGLSWATAGIDLLGAIKAGLGGALFAKALGISIATGFGLGFGIAAIVSITLTKIGLDEYEKQKLLATHTAWGDVTLDAETMKKVAEGLFQFSVTPTISLAKATIQNQETAKTELETVVTDFNSKLKVIELTFDLGKSKTNVFTSLTGGATDGTYTEQSLLGQIVKAVNGVSATMSVGVNPDSATNMLAQITGGAVDGTYTESSILGQVIGTVQKAKAEIAMGMDRTTSYTNMLTALTGGQDGTITTDSLIGQLLSAASGNGIELSVDEQKSVNAMLMTLLGNTNGGSYTQESIIGQLMKSVGEVDKSVTFGVNAEKSFSNMLNTLTGGATDGTYTEQSLLGQMMSTLGKMTDTISLGISLMPPMDENGHEMSAAQMLYNIAGSESLISDAAKNLGTDMAKLIAKGMEQELGTEEVLMIQKLGEWLNEISQAVLSGKIAGEFEGKVDMLLSDLDRASFTGVISEYETLKTELRQSYTDLAISQKAALKSLAAGTEATYKAYNDLYGAEDERTIKAYDVWQDALNGFIKFDPATTVENYMKNAVAPAREKVMTALSEIFKFDQATNDKQFKNNVSKYVKKSMSGLTDNVDIDTAAKNLNYVMGQIFKKYYSRDDFNAMTEATKALGVGYFDLATDEMKELLRESLKKYKGLDDSWIDELFENAATDGAKGFAEGLAENAEEASSAAEALSSAAVNALEGQDYYGAGQRSAMSFARGFSSVGIPSIGATGLGVKSVNLSGLKVGSVRFMASGGYPDNGELFVARESGAEMVGRIGRRTAVANNDQIVEGVASGVASGQTEQNALLREQNEYLRRIANKRFEANIVPSTALARVNRQSEQMRLRTEGA